MTFSWKAKLMLRKYILPQQINKINAIFIKISKFYSPGLEKNQEFKWNQKGS